MPELPEAETIARQLRKRLLGRPLRGVGLCSPRMVAEGGRLLYTFAGQRVTGVRRLGKAVLLDFSGQRCLLFRLGMTGALLVDGGGALAKHCHLVLRFGAGLRLQFVDARRFGGVYAHTAASLVQAPQVCRLGVDPLSREFSLACLRARLAGSRRPLKSLLTDQAVLAGIGNIYASEILFRARVHPLNRANTVSGVAAARLREETVKVLRAAIAARGTTVATYRDAKGERGEFAARLRVYGREGEPCVRCGRRIRRIMLGGRSTFFCPRCQPAPKRAQASRRVA